MRSTYFNSLSKRVISAIPEVESRNRDTMHAWECFVEHGHTNSEILDTVRSEILESWERCAHSGVNALSSAAPKNVEENDIYILRRKNLALCEATSLAFKRLAPHLVETGAILILTDRHGTIIDTVGDSKTLEAGRDISLEVGGVWDERVIGTNGIGTALRTGMPTYVHASEHFCQGIKSWTCVGVPILDALDRSVIGVVDLSGPSSIFRPHNVALVVATAREIELNLAQRQREEHTLLLEEFIRNSKRHDSDNAIVLINSSGKVVFNRNTENLTSSECDSFRTGTQLLDLYPDMSESDLAAALPSTLRTTNIDLIKVNGVTHGAALILHNQHTVTHQVKYSGISIKPRLGIAEEEVEIVGKCPKFLQAIEYAARAAKRKVAVLIQGETGVGKELFARLIHSHQTHRAPPYIVVNCATISPDLIKKELFGHIENTFNGASQAGKLGKFEQANKGVLCLDEIGDMPPELQPYFLRTLEQRAIYRLGCDIRRPIDVQLIAMSSRNIRLDIDMGRFRQDLFHRISTIVIDIPPLRERGQDIALLLEYFNNKLSKKYGREALKFKSTAMAAFQQYGWPGNVRELRNTVERLCLLNGSDIVSASDLPAEMIGLESNANTSTNESFLPMASSMDLEGIESIAVQRSIDLAKGNLTKAAASLGISRPTLYRKIKQYNLSRAK